MLAYVFMIAAIASEVVGTSLLKRTDGFTRLWPSVACLGAYALAFVFLSRAVKTIPVGIAYALWSGLGTTAIVIIGATFLGEPLSTVKVLGVGLIVAGVVVLNLGGGH
ncbi:multidrug efflux SMR transporter [Corallococcus sp. ZKHCc1 1396]|uniref:Multidrug efflux SMR transporter n=1 Tax=Corallococcus soli TaxID=2710757 RepID=A0ABR9PJZ0_9BACT|nr:MULTISPECIES: multidrug efflux SMR transporter [Corallococcus]MBE4748211.1 multidrug efflux SMR transporter [Corallococcus soli]MCY1033330.1 multidrug efflux SMR transporter [Corallococcus sp. BB11-1]RYZ14075.1 MAG: multidrug efflux SMR transporter [Myxococcaceae bacterium]